MLTPRYFNPTIAAGQRVPISAYGRFISILSITGAATVRMAIDADSFETVPTMISIDCEDRKYATIVFENNTAAAITVEVLLSETRVYNDRSAITLSNLTNLTQLALTNVAQTGIGTTVLFAANPARQEVQITADQGNAGMVFLGRNVANCTMANCFDQLTRLGKFWSNIYKGEIRACGNDAAENVVGYEV